jgi:predicted SnoaL-like aldol condensation-catalyzing enzyme
MTQTNSDILRSFIDEVTNQKHLNLIPKYLSKKYIAHGTPYVGVGCKSDDKSGDKIIIDGIFPDSPAEGKLMVGDEILRVFDGERTWKTFEELREGLWGHGVIGTPVTVWVRRDNVEQEITIVRGLVKAAEFSYQDVETGSREWIKEWPDLTTHLVNVIEAGDLVAYNAQNQGHNTRYGRSAVWAECGMVRVKDGKITDWWSVEDIYTQFKQLGYSIHEPVLAKV